MDQLSADSPITTRNEDALGYWPFAESLAKGLTQRIPRDGFVVGVQARWGMGKTSAINLILQAIRELESSKPLYQQTKIEKFNPWLFAGLEALAKGYLSQLGRVIQETVGDATPRKTSQFVEKLIKGGAEFVGGMTALAAMAVTSGAAAPLALPLKSAVSGALSFGAHVLDNRSLETMIDDLKTHLMTIDCRLLILVDDLDRLQPDELRQTLTLVKTFGNLPNVTHLLAYDRDIVNLALEPPRPVVPSSERLPTFLEKIVQAEFDLPYPTETGLQNLIEEKLTSIFGKVEAEIDIEDWMLLKHTVFHHYLRSPRDVLRLCNSLSVIWPGVRGEIYIPDLIAIELLRHHDHATYDLLREHKDYMLGRGPVGPENRSRLGRSILESVPGSRRADISELLATMFPAFAKSNELQFSYFRGDAQILAGRRIGDLNGFDGYFRFTPVVDEISIEKLRQVADHIGDEAFLITFMNELMEQKRIDGTSMIGSFLAHLPRVLDRTNRIGPQLLKAFLSLGDRIIEVRDEEAGFFLMSNRQRLQPVLTRVFEKTDPDSIRRVIEDAVDDTNVPVGAAAYVIAYLGAEHGLWVRGDNARSEAVLPRSDVERLGGKLARKIAELGHSNTLSITLTIDLVLRVWIVFGVKDEARGWVEKNLCDPITFTKIAFTQMSEVSSSRPPYRYRELRGRIDEELFDVHKMLCLAKKHQSSTALDAGDREDLQRFVAGLETRISMTGREPESDIQK